MLIYNISVNFILMDVNCNNKNGFFVLNYQKTHCNNFRNIVKLYIYLLKNITNNQKTKKFSVNGKKLFIINNQI